jgi:hypothetical protein
MFPTSTRNKVLFEENYLAYMMVPLRSIDNNYTVLRFASRHQSEYFLLIVLAKYKTAGGEGGGRGGI